MFRLLRTALGALLLTCLITAGFLMIVAADDASPAINLRLQTPVYTLGPTGPRVPGYALHDAPGAPRLPVHGMLVELPDDGEWELVYQSVGSRILPEPVSIPPAPGPDRSWLTPAGAAQTPDADLPATAPVLVQPDAAIYNANAFYPAAPVMAGDVARQRGKRLLPLRVFPFRYNPVSGALEYNPDLRIMVRMKRTKGKAVQTTSPPAARQPEPPAHPQSVDGSVRIRIDKRGVYRLTYAELAAASVPVDAIDPATLAMHNQNRPVAIRVTGEADGSFDEGDQVIFYAQPHLDRFNTQNVYFLTYGGAPGERMGAHGFAATTAPTTNIITQTLHFENDSSYYSSYSLPRDVDHFFDAPLLADSSTPTQTRTYALALDDPVTATGQVLLRAQLYGGQDSALAPDQSVKLSLNGGEVATFRWDGRTGYVGEATAPATLLDPSVNQAQWEVALSQLPGIDEYWVYIDWLDVSYPARAEAEGDSIYIAGIDSGLTEAKIFATSFTTGAIQVYDVRDPWQPVLITNTTAIDQGGSYDILFEDAWDDADPAPSYYLSSDQALLTPAAIEADAITTWRSPAHAYDYIAILPASLASAIQPLLDYRAAEGLRMVSIDVQDIYDEFSDGLLEPQAIRDFVSYAYANWNNGDAPPRDHPQYLLLVGDGHYDFRQATTSDPMLIPPYLVDVDPWLGEAPADNRYVSVDGPDDYLPDLHVGRISARTPADVTAVVDKILAYEDIAAAPSGDWQKRVTYVADKCNDPSDDFHAISNDIRQNWLPPFYDSPTIYYDPSNVCPDPGYTSAGAMRTAIRGAFDDTTLMLQWIGHASKLRWGSNSVFNIFDPPQLAANTQLPFSVSYACWSGDFTYVGPYGQSLAESLLNEPGRGSVATFSPSGLHVGGAVKILDQGVTEAVFQKRIARAGAAADAGRSYFFANSSNSHDLIDTMIYFGDPALTLRLPTFTPQAPVVTASAGAGTNLQLEWSHQLIDESYLIWRSADPYFDPAAHPQEQIAEIISGIPGPSEGASMIYDDDGSDHFFAPPDDPPLPAVQPIGDVSVNYFYLMRGVNAGQSSLNSNRVGEFDFALLPGAP